MEMITLAIGSTEYMLPSLALESSSVLHAMATSGMKEGKTKRIELHEDSAFAVFLYVQLAMAWINDRQFEKVSCCEGEKKGRLMAIRGLSAQELKESLTFFDKYQVEDSFSSMVYGNAIRNCNAQDYWQKLIVLDQHYKPWEVHESVQNWMIQSSELSVYVPQLSEGTRSKLLGHIVKKRRFF